MIDEPHSEQEVLAHLDERLVPDRFRPVFERAYTLKSRVDAIKANCLECQGYDLKAVYGCTARLCPLWRFRPRSRSPVDEANRCTQLHRSHDLDPDGAFAPDQGDHAS